MTATNPDPPSLAGALGRGFGDGRGPRLCDDLMPQPGFDDIDGLVDRVRAAGLRVAVTRQGTPGPWGPGAGLVVFRIVQEALTNTLKHAGPHARAEVLLRYGTDRAEIDVRDDGAGRPAVHAAVHPGAFGRHGLTGMLERAVSYGGGVEAGPREGTGWQVRARVRFGEP
jgi:signal transduction histidine kinase